MQTFDQALFDLFEANITFEGRAAQRRFAQRPAPADQADPASAPRPDLAGAPSISRSFENQRDFADWSCPAVARRRALFFFGAQGPLSSSFKAAMSP